MIVVNEVVSADIYCDDDEAFFLTDGFNQLETGFATIQTYREVGAPENIRNRVTIRRLEARYFYKLLDSIKEHIYE